MRIAVLGSGSRGNAVLVESGEHRILLDAGFSCRDLERRMSLLDFDPTTISALVITHEHGDHVRGADRFCRRFDVPVYGTAGTRDGTRQLSKQVHGAWREIRAGEPFEIEGFEIEPFSIPHDARDPVGLTVQDSAGRRLGLAADLGSASRLAWARLSELDCLILETNHDLDMLRSGPYPWVLKQRVAGRHGHLSNREAAEGLPELINDRLSWVVLYHLSQTNNLPALAATTIGEALDSEGSPARVVVTEQNKPSPWLEVPS